MRIVDLSRPLRSGMDVFEGDPPVRISVVRTRDEDGWELREICMGSHTGTHCDAPSHMHAAAATLDDIPLARFCGPAVAVRTTDASYPNGGVGFIFVDHVSEAAVPSILAARPNFVGGDLSEEAERALLQSGCVTYTDLANLDALPSGEMFHFYGFPLRIEGGDGSPVRAVAILSA